MPLDPEIAAWLETQKRLPPRSTLDIAATRERLRQFAALAGPPAEVHRVEDLVLAGYLRARQYWPAPGTALTLVVYFHGGRFISGDLDSHDAICRMLALAAHCRVIAIDYRLAPEHRFPAAAEDAALAVQWALGQGTPVAVAGDSAGANLATGAAMAHRGQALRCQLLIYPMIDATCSLPSYTAFAEGYGPGAADMKRGWREYLPEGADPRDPLASPLFAEDLADAPPALVLTAEYDTLRDEGEAYARRLGAAAKRYPGTIHAFFSMPGILQVARDAMSDAARFLQRHCA
jgi:acetyl esterase